MAVRWAACFIAIVLCSAAPAARGTDETQRVIGFIGALRAAWNGQASITPRGPRPYDIEFRARDAHCIEGAAEPGVSTHLWRFCADGPQLSLRFHSTFQGNTEPVHFAGTVGADGRALLKANDAGSTEVAVHPSRNITTIEIRRRDRPHVRIELERR